MLGDSETMAQKDDLVQAHRYAPSDSELPQSVGFRILHLR